MHPAHHSIRALTRSGFKLVAVTKGFTEYRASFMVPGNSTFTSLADLKGQKVIRSRPLNLPALKGMAGNPGMA